MYKQLFSLQIKPGLKESVDEYSIYCPYNL